MSVVSKTEHFQPFRLFNLPTVAACNVISFMRIVEVIETSMTSSKARKKVKSLINAKLWKEIDICPGFDSNPIIQLVRNYDVWIISFGIKRYYPDTLSCMNYYRLLQTNLEDKTADWKMWIEYLTEFLESPIVELSMDISELKDKQQSVIDWIKSRQRSIEKLSIYGENVSTEDFAIVENNKGFTKEFLFEMETDENFHSDFTFNGKSLTVYKGKWFKLNQLLNSDCAEIYIVNSLSDSEWNTFLRKWINMESNLNLKRLEFDIPELQSLFSILLLPSESVASIATNAGMNMIENKFKNFMVIRRNDGAIGVLGIRWTKGHGSKVWTLSLTVK